MQTVLRLFGSKAALIVLANEAGMPDRRHGARRDEIAAALRELHDAYEQRGDGTASAGEAERAAQRSWIDQQAKTDRSVPTTVHKGNNVDFPFSTFEGLGLSWALCQRC